MGVQRPILLLLVAATGSNARKYPKMQPRLPGLLASAEMKPKRNAVHLEFSVEDAARMPGLEESLTRDMRAGLMEAVDKSHLRQVTQPQPEQTADITLVSIPIPGLLEKTISQTNKLKPAETLQGIR